MAADNDAQRPHWEDVVADEAARWTKPAGIRRLLDFERRSDRRDPARESKIRAELGLTPARYEQLLGRAIDTRAALEYDAILVGHLRLRRELNRGIRASRYDEQAGGR